MTESPLTRTAKEHVWVVPSLEPQVIHSVIILYEGKAFCDILILTIEMQPPSTTIQPQPPSGGTIFFRGGGLGTILVGTGPLTGTLGGGLLGTNFLLLDCPPISPLSLSLVCLFVCSRQTTRVYTILEQLSALLCNSIVSPHCLLPTTIKHTVSKKYVGVTPNLRHGKELFVYYYMCLLYHQPVRVAKNWLHSR